VGKLSEKVPPVFRESVGCKPRHIFEKHCRGHCLLNEAKGLGKKVALVFVAELFSSNGEWRAGNATSEKVNTAKISAIDFVDGSFDYLPLWAILAEGVASIIVNLYGGGEVKASGFETRRLSSASRTNLQNC
jgi:hypothetical protein